MKCKAWKFDGGKTSVKKGWKCSLTFESGEKLNRERERYFPPLEITVEHKRDA